MKHVMALPLIVLCAAFAQIVPAQQAPAKTTPSNQTERSPARQKREGVITGRVIGADGQPAPDAGVFAYRISERSGPGHSAASDEEGNFKLTGLSPGAYILSAHASGYVSAGVPDENAIHRIGENVTINLVKGGVITGRVTDEAGEPMVGVTVSPHRLRDLEGKTTGSGVEWFGLGVGMTDDRGIYRIYGLRPGVYIVSIGSGAEHSPDDTQIRRDAPSYHPSATRDTAAEINLRGGEEVSGIDIRHRGDRGRVVSGLVSTVSGEIESSTPYNSVSVMLKGFETGLFEAMTSVSNPRGFAFYGVPDGAYELTAMRVSDGGETSSSARRRVSVKGVDVNGVELKLAPRGSIAGRIVIESSNPPKRCAIKGDPAENQTSGQIQEQAGRRPVVEEIILRADRDDPNPRAQMSRFFSFDRYGRPPNEKGEFALKNLDAARYRITTNLPDDAWYLRAVTQPGAGASKKPVNVSRDGIAVKPGEKLSGVDVIVAQGAATLTGRVVSAKDGMKAPSHLRAHLIPAEASAVDDVLRYAEANIRADGAFEFKHLAPGKYLLLARQQAEKESGAGQVHPVAWDAAERMKLRREVIAAKNEIELQPCGRVKDYVLRFNP